MSSSKASNLSCCSGHNPCIFALQVGAAIMEMQMASKEVCSSGRRTFVYQAGLGVGADSLGEQALLAPW